MSHVDEGALHAYLDGALDEFPEAEAERVRLHLERCERCVGELEVARRLRAEAETILGLASPDVALPTLEELRAVEKRRRPASPGVRRGLQRLGWAASVAVAMGAGWLLREGQLRQVDVASVAPIAQADVAEVETPEGDTAPTLVSQADEAVAPVEPRPTTSASDGATDTGPRTAAEGTSPVWPGAGAASRPGDSGGARTAVLLEAPDAPAALVDDRQVASRRLATAQVARVSVVSAAPTATSPNATELSPSSGNRSGMRFPVASASAVDGSGMARRRELSDDDLPRDKAVALAVPGHDVRSITNLGTGRVSLGVRVEQSLEGSATFEVFHLELGVAPDVLDPASPGVAEVRVESEEGWVVIRGRLDDATLADLLARLFSP